MNIDKILNPQENQTPFTIRIVEHSDYIIQLAEKHNLKPKDLALKIFNTAMNEFIQAEKKMEKKGAK